jgi:uncharacterized protein (TIGR02246 family)
MDASRPNLPDVHRPTFVLRMSLAVLVAGVAGLGSPGAVAAQATADPAAVRALVEAYRTMWNGHDPSGLAGFFTEDADMIMGTDPIASGRKAIEGWWRDYFARQEPQRHVAIEVHAVRPIAPDVAVMNVTTTTLGRSAQGEELTSRNARGTWVVVRRGDAWGIAAMRGMPTQRDQIIRAANRRGKLKRRER